MPSYYEWRFVVEIAINPTEWRSVNNYDTLEEATKDAKERPGATRVRQFKTTIFTEDPTPRHNTPTPVIPTPEVPFFCPSHPKQTSTAYASSRPRCPDCKQEMFRGTGLNTTLP